MRIEAPKWIDEDAPCHWDIDVNWIVCVVLDGLQLGMAQ